MDDSVLQGDESSVVKAFEIQIGRLIKANAKSRLWRWIQGIMIIILACIVIVLALLYIGQQHESRATCKQGNTFRAEQTQIWNEVIALSQQSPNNNSQVDEKFREFVAKVDAPQNCQ